MTREEFLYKFDAEFSYMRADINPQWLMGGLWGEAMRDFLKEHPEYRSEDTACDSLEFKAYVHRWAERLPSGGPWTPPPPPPSNTVIHTAERRFSALPGCEEQPEYYGSVDPEEEF